MSQFRWKTHLIEPIRGITTPFISFLEGKSPDFKTACKEVDPCFGRPYASSRGAR
jgi:hypothetical protein